MSDNHPRILIIEDEKQIRTLLQISLTPKGLKIITANNGNEGLLLINNIRPDLIILDIGLPDFKGTELLFAIREISTAPIIMLSVQNETTTIVEALNNGADDYITKPFEPNELAARIFACLRRNIKKEFYDEIIIIKNIKINLSSRFVEKNGLEVKLTSTEYDLLKVFLKNIDRVLTSRQLLKEVWGGNAIEQSQYLRVYVGHLRQKLEDAPDNPTLFQTEPGIGYRLSSK